MPDGSSAYGAAGAARRIAIIGAGITGLGAAYALAPRARVTVFETEQRLGGHARTVLAGRHGDQPVDTGFIVFNHATYPRLTPLLAELGVETVPSDMSFSASVDGGRLEYALGSLDEVFAQRRNLARPAFLRMIRDILRFNRDAEGIARGRPDLTLGGLVAEMGLGPRFADWYLKPFSGAIWSTPPQGMLAFPAEAFLRFFRNHGLLGHNDGHQWMTIKGGSREYVSRIEAHLHAHGASVRLGTSPEVIRRAPDGVEIRVQGTWEMFDEVIVATHTDTALGLMGGPTPTERAALSAIRYQENAAILHCDEALMPKRRKCWSSWNYSEPAGGTRGAIPLTYWMNRLQPIPVDDPLFVTLNGADRIDPAKVYDRTSFSHPVYDHGTLAAQEALRAHNGAGGIWFAGAWMYNGFHEDGLRAGQEAAAGILARPAMAVAAE